MLYDLVSNYGTIGAGNDAAILQAAINANDGHGIPIALDQDLNLYGTVYLGNTILLFAGHTINCHLSSSFSKTGTGSQKQQGAILTKSGQTATGPGAAPVNITFLDTARFMTTRTDDSGSVKAGLLLENTASLTAPHLIASAIGTGNSELVPLDFYAGVQGVRISVVETSLDNPGANGGAWIRNTGSVPYDTADIVIDQWIGTTNAVDEALAIFNSVSASNDVHDVHIGLVKLRASRGTLGLSIFRNVGDYDPTKMQRISIDQVEVIRGDFTWSGNGAVAAASVSAGAVTAVTVSNPGSRYFGGAGVILSGGGGSGATATATISSGTIANITVTSPGSGYTSAPTVSFYSLEGGFAVKAQRCYPSIGTVTIFDNGTWDAAYHTVFGIRFAPGTGQVLPLTIGRVEYHAEGSNSVPNTAAMLFGYISVGQLVVRGAGSGWNQVAYGTASLPNVDCQCLSYSNNFAYGSDEVCGLIDGPMRDVGQFRGQQRIDAFRWPATTICWYPTSARTYAGALRYDGDVVIPGTTASATAVVDIPSGTVTAITLSSGGSGYAAVPEVTLVGGGGSGATVTAIVSAGIVQSIAITNPGTGYTASPTITIAGPSAGKLVANVINVNALVPSKTTLVEVKYYLDNSAGASVGNDRLIAGGNVSFGKYEAIANTSTGQPTRLAYPNPLTVSSGTVTLVVDEHAIDTSNVAVDISSLNGGRGFDRVILKPSNPANAINIDNGLNIKTYNGETLKVDGGNWAELRWYPAGPYWFAKV